MTKAPETDSDQFWHAILNNTKPVKSTCRPRQLRVRPSQQGAFDGFCGLYAIINATRLIAYPSDGIGEDFCDDFFNGLLRQASRYIELKLLIHHGTPQWLMRILLGWACIHVERRTALKPIMTRPFLGRGQYPSETILAAKRGLLSHQNCAFIVELGGTHSHWTVIHALSEAQVHLFDSSGLKLLNTRELRMSYEKTRPQSRHVLMARSIFLLRRGPAEAEAE